MPAPFTLHLMQPQDRNAFESLLTSLSLPTEDLSPDLHTFWVAKEDGKIVGSVGLELYGAYALLRSMAVAPSKQGTGLGKALHKQAMHLAATNGIGEVFLITTTAAPFFVKQGFAPIERSSVPIAIQKTAQFGSVCPSSATIMHQFVS